MALSPYSPKSKAFIKTPIKDHAFITILDGSVRSSKTFTMIPKFFQLCKYEVAGLKLITGKSKNTLYNNILNDLFDFAGKKNYNYNRQSGELEILGSKWLVIGAKDEGSEAYIRGLTAGVVYSDELSLMPESFFKMLLSRLSVAGARMFGTTNPDSPFHYLKKDYIDNEDMIVKKQIQTISFNLNDNLSLTDEARERFASMYKGVFKKRFIDGLWVLAEGAIYKDSFNDDLVYNDDSRAIALTNSGGFAEMFVAIDYGTNNPCVFLHIVDDGSTYWVDREYYYDSNETGVQKTDKQYREDLQSFLNEFAPGAQCIVDPSAASFKVELEQQGIWHCDADNEVLTGIGNVSSLFAQKKIRIHERCKKLIKELEAYSWDEKAQKIGESKPIKKHDHAPDALRYFVETKVPAWRISLL